MKEELLRIRFLFGYYSGDMDRHAMPFLLQNVLTSISQLMGSHPWSEGIKIMGLSEFSFWKWLHCTWLLLRLSGWTYNFWRYISCLEAKIGKLVKNDERWEMIRIYEVN